MIDRWPTWVLVLLLLAAMIVADEIGFRLGRRDDQESELSRSVSNALKGSIFGLVALLLGFSFSATTSRFDTRQRLVVDQANAIGTCYLRAALLDAKPHAEIQASLRNYLDARVRNLNAGRNQAEIDSTHAAINQHLDALWKAVEEAHRQSPNTVRTSLIIPAANEVIDLSSTRTWANRNHLPAALLAVLIIVVIISSLLLGHSSGQAGRRHLGLWLASNTVFALVLFVVLDFDLPRRGLIRVDQTPLLEVRDSIAESPRPTSP